MWSELRVGAGQAAKPASLDGGRVVCLTNVSGLCCLGHGVPCKVCKLYKDPLCGLFVCFLGGGEVAGSINEKRQECEVWGWTVSEETLALVR